MTFELFAAGKPPNPTRPTGPRVSGRTAKNYGKDDFDTQWQTASEIAGRLRNDMALEAIVSPIDRDRIGLVVSLVKVQASAQELSSLGERDSALGDQEGKAQPAAEDSKSLKLDLLVRDEKGREAPLTATGRKWLREHGLQQRSSLRAGEAVGLIVPLAGTFAISPRRSYTILAAVSASDADVPLWVSLPTTFRVDEPPVPGVNRPPYGSSRFWDRLTDLCENRKRAWWRRRRLMSNPEPCN